MQEAEPNRRSDSEGRIQGINFKIWINNSESKASNLKKKSQKIRYL